MLSASSRALLSFALACLLPLALGACASLLDTGHPLAGRVWDPAAQVFRSPEELLQRAAAADFVLLGEIHDNPEHHRLQAETITYLLERGIKPALLMEQFQIDQQAAIENATADGKDLAPLMRGWDASQYRPILDVARRHGITPRGANLSRDRLRQVVGEGYAGLAPGEAERLGLFAAWDDTRENYMAGVIETSHCGKLSAAQRNGLVRAQRLRDAVMAETLLGGPYRSAIMILGRGHARRDVGVPRYIETRAPGTRILSIGFVEVGTDKPHPTDYDGERVGNLPAHDLVWFTPRAGRPDPCLAFGR